MELPRGLKLAGLSGSRPQTSVVGTKKRRKASYTPLFVASIMAASQRMAARSGQELRSSPGGQNVTCACSGAIFMERPNHDLPSQVRVGIRRRS